MNYETNKQPLFNSSQFGGIKYEPLRYSKFLLDLLRDVNSCLGLI